MAGAPRTEAGIILANTAWVLLRMRSALLSGDLTGMIGALRAASDARMAEGAGPELAALTATFEEAAAGAELLGALRGGRVGGVPGALDVSNVQLGALDAAISHAESNGIGRGPPGRLQSLLLTALALRRLRAAAVALIGGGRGARGQPPPGAAAATASAPRAPSAAHGSP